MLLSEILLENKLEIVEKWLAKVFSSYSDEGVRFFKKEKDRFANPLGYNATKGVEDVYEILRTGGELEVPEELKKFVKLRAVQDFSPSKSVSFIYDLKKTVLDVCRKDLETVNLQEWIDFETRVDELALKVFDLYMEDRELISQIKVNEVLKGNHVMANGRCPSAMMRKNKEEKIELRVMRKC